MKKQFQNLAIECWQHSGARLGKSEPCLCLKASPDAIDTLREAICELQNEGPPAKRTLTLQPSSRRRRCEKIRLVLSNEGDDLRQMSITRHDDTAILEFAPNGLDRFLDAVVGWQKGDEDFFIRPLWNRNKKGELGPKDLASGELWFWREMEP